MQGRHHPSETHIEHRGSPAPLPPTTAVITSTTVKPSTAPSRRQSKNTSKNGTQWPLNVINVVLCDRVIKPLYPSLYRFEILVPEPVERLFVCERCYKYTADAGHFCGHARFCDYAQTIPGKVIYSKGRYSVYELDGEEHHLLAQNLSLFSKLFIETKSVCFDVTNFLYYLLVDRYPHSPFTPRMEATDGSYEGQNGETAHQRPQIVAFFSKEKISWDNNNLACILVFPPWQKRGLGQLLVGVSYELSRRQRRLGGPERPLSLDGARSYTLYWCQAVARTILALPANRRISIKDIVDATYILHEDVIGALSHMSVVVTPETTTAQSPAEKIDVGLKEETTSTPTPDTSPKRRANGHDKSALKSLGKYTLKKAQGCVMVDRAILRQWYENSRKDGQLDTELQVDSNAFVEGALLPIDNSMADEGGDYAEEELDEDRDMES